MCQLIELWETYLLQMDSDEDGPPLMPAGVVADTDPKSDAQIRREVAKAQLEAEEGHDDDHEPRMSGTTARESEDLHGDGGDQTPFDEAARAAAAHSADD